MFMSEQNVGNFKMRLWTGGHPIWCLLSYGETKYGDEMKFSHAELADLKYLIESAMKTARNALPPNYKDEV
jgi:hypothetical protein